MLEPMQRMPGYVTDPAGAVHYETIGVIQGMQHLPATFTPGPRLGMGLDEKAIEAVRNWKFEPAMKDGKPVAVQINVEVSFRLY